MIRRRTQRAFLALVLVLAAKSVCADIVQPIGVQIREQEPNAFLVQWSVPQTYPVQAMPEPVLPEDCRPTGERVLREQVGTWLNRQVFRCQDGLTGRELGIRYPFVSAGQSAMIRLELLSGEQLIHALNPGEDSWLVPELDAGLTAELWSNLQRAVLDGVRHFLGGWLHLALWLTLVLLANARLSLRLVGAFTAAQLVALLLNGLVGSSLPPGMAEAGVAIAVVLLAGQTLLPPEARRQLISVTAVAGLIHGLGLPQILPGPLSFSSVEWLYHLLTILGMDAAFLGLTLIATGLLGRRGEPSRPGTVRRVVSYGLGAAGAAAGLFLVLAAPVADAGAAQGAGQLPTLPGSTEGATVAGSRRVAAQGTQAPLQSFLSVQAFEVRHQVLVQIRDLRSELDLEDVEELSVEAQPGVKARLEQMTLPLAIVAIDGEPAAPIVDRIDFLTVGTQGVLPRSEPLLERVIERAEDLILLFEFASCQSSSATH